MSAMRNPITKDISLTVSGVANRLQLPKRAVRYWLEKGELWGDCGSTGWRITERDLQVFLNEKANVESATWRLRLKKR